MRRLVLVRHGESEWNQLRRVQGQSGTGLSTLGRQQAAVTAEVLAAAHPAAVLVSSDLQRCRETAAPIADRLGVEPVLDAQVRERRFGRWEGLLLSEVESTDPDLWARWCDGEDVCNELGGESNAELGARAAAAFRRHLAALDDGATAVIVTHGGPIWHGLHRLFELRQGTLGGVGNTSITEIGADGDSLWLGAWNQMSHLPAELRTTKLPVGSRLQAPAVGR